MKRKTLDLSEVTIDFPDGPRHTWKRPEIDQSGQKKDNFGDVVKVKHTGGHEVLIAARDFGAQALSHALVDLVSQIAQRK